MDTFPEIPGYRIENKIGQGRLTDVYLAVKEGTGQQVVVKVLLPELVREEDEEFSRLFLYKAQQAAKLDHPNIAKIIDVGETPGSYYYVREYFQECLRTRIYNRNFPSGFETGREGDSAKDTVLNESEIQEIVDIFKQSLDALEYAHRAEFIHHDIRPENIFLKEEIGFITPVIVDFCMQQVADISQTLDKKGLILKDPHYTCPTGLLKKKADNSGDLYSLGITFYEMLTGHVPYDAREPKALEDLHKTAPLPQLPAHLSRFQSLLDRMMAKNAEERAESASELIQMMSEHNEDSPMELTSDIEEIDNGEAQEISFATTNNNNIKTTPYNPKAEMETLEEIDHGYGEDIESTADTGEKIGETDQENTEFGDEFRKDLREQEPEPDYPVFEESSPRHPFETRMKSPTRESYEPEDLLSKIKNPRVFIPAAAVIIIIIALAIFFLKPSNKPAAGNPDDATAGQEIPGDAQDGLPGESIDVQYTRKLKQAQRKFETEEYEKALELIIEVEKIKTNPEVETLKKQIQEKFAEKNDDTAYQKSLQANTEASLAEYLSKFPSGRHAAAVRDKITEIKEIEDKRNEEKRKWAASQVKLRSTPQTLDKNGVKALVKKRGFYEKYYNSTGNFLNHYELQTINDQKVVLDYATGLMWHQSGSQAYMKYERIQPWLQELNQGKYAGYSDWRLPTLEEVASLMESSENRDALYIDPIFSKEQNHTWTADKYNENKAWAVDIFGGDFNAIAIDYDSFVRPVRTIK